MPKNDRSKPIPYRIAVLCDLRDAQGRILLIHRHKEPNKGLYSPIGGKLDVETGESPAMAAQREIEEEAGIRVAIEDLRLVGVVSEAAYQGDTHWLMFWYRVVPPVEVRERTIREGSLEWHPLSRVPGWEGTDGAPDGGGALPMPETDRRIIWPLVLSHGQRGGGVFSLHIDCSGPELRWTVEES